MTDKNIEARLIEKLENKCILSRNTAAMHLNCHPKYASSLLLQLYKRGVLRIARYSKCRGNYEIFYAIKGSGNKPDAEKPRIKKERKKARPKAGTENVMRNREVQKAVLLSIPPNKTPKYGFWGI